MGKREWIFVCYDGRWEWMVGKVIFWCCYKFWFFFLCFGRWFIILLICELYLRESGDLFLGVRYFSIREKILLL